MRRHRPAHDLDPLDIRQCIDAEIERRARIGASLIGIPSRSTSTWLELVPRTNTLALPPGPPDCETRMPGTADSASVQACCNRAVRSPVA